MDGTILILVTNRFHGVVRS